MSDTHTQGIPRLHDMDALRAFAMLLGIMLHCALSFSGEPWVVQDLKTNGMFGWINGAIHGFRMPLFMLVSGFFTMMLWRRRGLKALLKQRFQRIVIPLVLAMLTVIPALHWASTWAIETSLRQDARRRASPGATSDLVETVRQDDLAGLERLLTGGADPNTIDAEFGVPTLTWAAMYGNVPAAKLLLDHGAQVNGTDKDGYGPLHGAAFLGHAEMLDLLLQRGADPGLRSKRGETPRDSAKADWGATKFIADIVRIPLRAREDLEGGRAECRQLLARSSGEPEEVEANAGSQGWGLDAIRKGYAGFLSSDRFLVRLRPDWDPFHLVLSSVFDHLWFLWFLCWFVAGFALLALLAERLAVPGLPRWLIISPLRLIWLLPLTMVPQLVMGVFTPSFGPDTSTGLIPQPHLLVYYGIFFGFGALYFDCDDRDGRLGRWWWASIPLALLAWPVGIFTIGQTVATGVAQVVFTWGMTFGMIGLFRRFLARENRTIRYVSDSAYWLYLTHLPLVILLQLWVREWELSAPLKFLLIFALVTGFLMIVYDMMVRYTWLGRILNGPRTRRVRVPVSGTESAIAG